MSFIVINDTMGTATRLLTKSDDTWEEVPKTGILICDEHIATEFPTRDAANRAVSQTEDYLSRRRCAGDRSIFRVFRLQPKALAK